MLNPEVFREYDVRGVVGKDLDYVFVRDLGKAIGTYGRNNHISVMTVGMDCRLSSDDYKKAVIEGITSTGINVYDIGICATPMNYFSIRHLNAGGGVMVTGSHNPPEFNGLKISIGPDTIHGDEIQRLRTIMESGRYASGHGSVESYSITEHYYEFIANNVSIRPGLHVAVDGGNGVGGYFALPLLERFHCTVEALYCDMDGRFPHHFPDPTVPDNLKDIIRVVEKTHADVGIAYDGDADRLGVITDSGSVLWGDELLILFSRFILKEHPGAAIIGEVKCSQKLFDDIEQHGGRAIMWKAGHSLIKSKMKEEHALLAGEMSGHLFFADRYFGFDGAIYASMRLLEIISHSEYTISELLSDLPRTYSTPELRIDCPDAIKFEVVRRVKDHFSANYRIIDIDGVRVNFDNGWGLVRASNTQPVLVLRFESQSEEGLSRIRELMESVLNKTIAGF